MSGEGAIMENEIKNIIKTIVMEYYGIKLDDNKNMFGNEYPFLVSDILFIIYCLEQRLNKPITSIFKTNDSGILTPSNLAVAIAQL